MAKDQTVSLEERMLYLRAKGVKIAYSPRGIPYNAAVPVFNRRMQLVIPTHKRPTRQITLKSLSPELQKECLVLTSTVEDAKIIRKTYRDILSPEQVYPINRADVDSIAKKRQWIIENVGATSVFQLDDDGYFFARCPVKYRHVVDGCWEIKPEYKNSGIKLLGTKNFVPDELTQAFRDIQDRLTTKDRTRRFSHVGLSSRMGNNQEDEEWKVIGRMMHAIGHRRDTLLQENIRFDEVQLREDFNVTLRLLQKGYPNTILYTFCISPAPYGREGGVSEERTVKRSNEQAKLLASMYPDFVKVVEKDYEFSHRRLEVKVAWQKIYKAAVAKKTLNNRKSLF